MKDGKVIQLSAKHGLNMMIPTCFYCGGDKNELIMLGRLKGDRPAPKRGVVDKEPCDRCIDYMTKGVILVSVKDNAELGNPYRTGGFCVVKDDVAQDIFPAIGDSRFAFIEDTAWDMVGLPRE